MENLKYNKNGQTNHRQKTQEELPILLPVHLQGPQEHLQRHWNLSKGNEGCQLPGSGYVRAARSRVLQAGQIQQQENPFFHRCLGCCQAPPD